MMILVLLSILIILLFNSSISGHLIDDRINSSNYMYTKALCNERNLCQDYEITCKNKETVSLTPIDDAVIQHHKDWKDPRNEKNNHKLC